MERERRRVAGGGRVGRRVRPVRIETLDRRLRLRLDPQVAGRPDTDEQSAGLRIDDEMAVLVPLDQTKYALRRDHLRPISAGHRAALLRRHLIDALLLAATGTERAAHARHTPDGA